MLRSGIWTGHSRRACLCSMVSGVSAWMSWPSGGCSGIPSVSPSSLFMCGLPQVGLRAPRDEAATSPRSGPGTGWAILRPLHWLEQSQSQPSAGRANGRNAKGPEVTCNSSQGEEAQDVRHWKSQDSSQTWPIISARHHSYPQALGCPPRWPLNAWVQPHF